MNLLEISLTLYQTTIFSGRSTCAANITNCINIAVKNFVLSRFSAKFPRKILLFSWNRTSYQEVLLSACTKTRNGETKPPKRNDRNHRNEQNETTETAEMRKTTKTKQAQAKPPKQLKQKHRNKTAKTNKTSKMKWPKRQKQENFRIAS